MLEREFNFYLKHQDELVAQYRDKYIVIKGNKVLGAYDDELVAYLITKNEHPVDTSLIHLCQPGVANYTQTFRRAVFK